MSGCAPHYLCGDRCGGGLRRCSPQRSGSVLEMARGDVAWSRLAYAARHRAQASVWWVWAGGRKDRQGAAETEVNAWAQDVSPWV